MINRRQPEASSWNAGMQTQTSTLALAGPGRPLLLGDNVRKKLAIAGLLAGILVGAVLLMTPNGPGPLASAGARLQAAAGLADQEYDLSETRYFLAAAAKVNDEYVDPARVDPDAMLRSALDRVARRTPEVVYEVDATGRRLDLLVGDARDTIELPELDSVAELTGVVRKVASFLDRNLDEDVERPPIEYALMNGMLETLDPHSVYIEPDYYKEMSIQNRGHFGGLGITIGIREKRLTILYPLKDTPAWRAGLQAGDRIDKIGSESTVNMSLQEAVGKLRGEVGTEVTITVSDEENPDREVTITRAKIEVPSVEWAYAGDGVGLIEIAHFAAQTYDRLEDALEELETDAMGDKQGKLKGVVIDLRQNPGGYLQQAIEVADKFLPGGVIVATEGLAGSARDVTSARKFGTEDELPIVLLVDEASASASEIVAGALQQHDRALVLGVRTFGKGSVQNLYDRDFHQGALKLTIAQYLTAGDQSIQGLGVLPDIELRPALVKLDEDGQSRVQLFWQDFELREEDLPTAFDWGAQDEDANLPRWVYSCAECFEPVDYDKASGAGDHIDDLSIQAAKALILAAPSPRGSDMLKIAPETLDKLFLERQERLEKELMDLGIEWTAAPARPARKGQKMPPASLTASLEVESQDGTLTPGQSAAVTLTVTNTGDKPLHRVRAVTQANAERGFFNGREYVFGKLAPGQSRSFSVKATPAMWLHARTEGVKWHFFTDGATPPPPFVSRLRIKEVPHPRFSFAWQVVDDGTGGSRGNGDGLLQPGEEIDLLVSIKNTGSGPTSDLVRAASEQEEDAPEQQNGFVTLRNRSAESLFLTEGSASFSLQPGEISVHRLHFRVADDLAGVDSVEAELTVGDQKFLQVVSADLEIPLFGPGDPIAAVERRMKPKFGTAQVRAGSSEHSEVVATVGGPVEVDGRLGQWFRTPLPWGTSGWISASHLVPAARSEEPVQAQRYLSNSPPVVTLASNPGGTVVVSEVLKLSGLITDDDDVKDLFVFVNDKKISYERLSGGVEAPFAMELELDPGENQIEIFARDAEDHLGSMSLGVYRETATAAIEGAAKDAIIR
jgi:carboxyl-terminal processing protease